MFVLRNATARVLTSSLIRICLMTSVLFNLNIVSSRVMHKYETESRKVGKSSFAYAWVLDETNEERERGITMDVGHSGNKIALSIQEV